MALSLERYIPSGTDAVLSLNIFKSCMWLKYLGKTVMVLVVGSLVAMANYSVWTQTLGPGIRFGHSNGKTSDSDAVETWFWGQIMYFILACMYSGVIAMLVWCYARTVMDCPGRVPDSWFPFSDESDRDALQRDEVYRTMVLEQYEESLRVARREVAAAGERSQYQNPLEVAYMYATRPRWCKKCQIWKPPRSHHCSMKNQCVLKMDHYCVWMANTIGLLNYKSFVLFLAWTCLACIFSAFLLISPCIAFVQGNITVPVWPSIISFMSFVFTASFTLALIGFLIMHTSLIGKNKTTIEAYEKQTIDPWPHDKGWRENMSSVFGKDPVGWFLPRLTDKEKKTLLEEHLNVRVPKMLNV